MQLKDLKRGRWAGVGWVLNLLYLRVSFILSFWWFHFYSFCTRVFTLPTHTSTPLSNWDYIENKYYLRPGKDNAWRVF